MAGEWVTTWLDTGGLIVVTGYIDGLKAGVFGTVEVIRDGVAWVIEWKDVLVALGIGVLAVGGAWGVYTAAIWLSTAATTAWGAAVAVATGGISLVIPLILAAIVGGDGRLVLWGDEIKDFLAGIANRFLGWIESVLDWVRPLADMMGITLPEQLGRFDTAAAEVTVELGEMQRAWEDLSAEQQAAQQDQYTAELIRQADAGATLTKEQQALVLAQREGAFAIGDLRDGWASLDAEGQAANMRNYVASLEEAEAQGFKLTDQEYALIDALDGTTESASEAAEEVGALSEDVATLVSKLSGAGLIQTAWDAVYASGRSGGRLGSPPESSNPAHAVRCGCREIPRPRRGHPNRNVRRLHLRARRAASGGATRAACADDHPDDTAGVARVARDETRDPAQEFRPARRPRRSRTADDRQVPREQSGVRGRLGDGSRVILSTRSRAGVVSRAA